MGIYFRGHLKNDSPWVRYHCTLNTLPVKCNIGVEACNKLFLLYVSYNFEMETI